MEVRAGTSGYAFKEWKGTFYPKEVRDDGILTFYASRFPAVEINNTFYRMPKESVLVEWASRVPEGFRFAIKASQRITHHSRLKDAGENLAYFTRVASVLGEKRGPTLFQLPPNLKKDLPRLEEFLALLPRNWRATFEFRHSSWFDDTVFEALRAKGAALCIADTEDLETPLIATTDWGYLRLHRPAYDPAALASWAAKLKTQPWSEAYVFFKHDLEIDSEQSGPPAAAAFLTLSKGSA